jgi:hypothetical protein
MNEYLWEAILTAQTGVVHSGDTLGTTTYLRRERTLHPDGHIEEIPVISGNSVRGRLRDLAVDAWWNDRHQPQLPAAVVHALFSGGSLTRATDEPLSGQRLQQVHDLCPPLEIFGAAGGGRILDGAAHIGKMVPLTQQTQHLLPPTYQSTTAPDMWNVINVDYFTRKRRARDEQAAPLRFGVETFIPGTQFYWWARLHPAATPAAVALFADTITTWITSGTIGGRLRSGYGRIAGALHTTPTSLPSLSLWKHNTPFTSDEYATLAWLN